MSAKSFDLSSVNPKIKKREFYNLKFSPFFILSRVICAPKLKFCSLSFSLLNFSLFNVNDKSYFSDKFLNIFTLYAVKTFESDFSLSEIFSLFLIFE